MTPEIFVKDEIWALIFLSLNDFCLLPCNPSLRVNCVKHEGRVFMHSKTKLQTCTTCIPAAECFKVLRISCLMDFCL